MQHESEYQVSLNYYKESYEIASAKMDDSGLNYKFFAIIGILNSFSLMSKTDQDKSEIDLWGNRLNELGPMKNSSFPGMKDGDLGWMPLTHCEELGQSIYWRLAGPVERPYGKII